MARAAHSVKKPKKKSPATSSPKLPDFEQLVAMSRHNQDYETLVLLFTQATEQYPNDAEYHYNRGVALAALRRFAQALESYDVALHLNPRDPYTHNNRGIALSKLQRHEEARISYDRALALKPDYPQAYNNRGNALNELKQFTSAIASFKRAIALKPDYAEAYNNHGCALGELERHTEALTMLDRALALKPNYANALCLRGVALGKLGRHEEALKDFDAALALHPAYPEAHNNRGNALVNLGRFDEAMVSFERALALYPDYAIAYRNKGILHLDELQFDQARACFNRAIDADPSDKSGVLDKSLVALIQGDFAEGWQLYEARHACGISRDMPGPLWLGDAPLSGKTILLYWEQGMGDTIQLCRYVPLVAALGARVILEVQKPLVKLVRPLDGIAHLIVTGDPIPPYDYRCPMLSLPLAFGSNASNVPSPYGYLTAKPTKTEFWNAKLGDTKRPRIGLVWSGNPDHKRDHDRSIPLLQMLAHLPTEAQYISLQRDVRAADQVALKASPNLLHFGEALTDFTDTAGLIANLDLIITVDTSVAHLAASMGKPTWILLSYRPDFRWMLTRSDSPWYASANLYRQEKRGDWTSVLERVANELTRFAR